MNHGLSLCDVDHHCSKRKQKQHSFGIFDICKQVIVFKGGFGLCTNVGTNGLKEYLLLKIIFSYLLLPNTNPVTDFVF